MRTYLIAHPQLAMRRLLKFVFLSVVWVVILSITLNSGVPQYVMLPITLALILYTVRAAIASLFRRLFGD